MYIQNFNIYRKEQKLLWSCEHHEIIRPEDYTYDFIDTMYEYELNETIFRSIWFLHKKTKKIKHNTWPV